MVNKNSTYFPVDTPSFCIVVSAANEGGGLADDLHPVFSILVSAVNVDWVGVGGLFS